MGWLARVRHGGGIEPPPYVTLMKLRPLSSWDQTLRMERRRAGSGHESGDPSDGVCPYLESRENKRNSDTQRVRYEIHV
jgi:hypothetical protein